MNFEAATAFLAKADHLLIVSHQNPDGDAIGSTLAAAYICQWMGKPYTLANESPMPPRFSFLPRIGEIQRPEQISERFRYVLALDAADGTRVGTSEQLYGDEVEILNIDHHPTNDRFGDVNVIQNQAAATCEILFDWVESLSIPLDARIATYLYTGLSTDTGGFRYANTSAKVLNQAAALVSAGVQVQEITDFLYSTTTIRRLQTLQLALSRLTVSESGTVAWMSINQDDSVSEEDVDGIVNYARNIEGVDVGILFRELDDQRIRVSLRSKRVINVGEVAHFFGGGGHARAAGCSIQGDMEEVQTQVLRRIEQEWRKT